MNDRDRQILDHIGLYRISLRAVLSRSFFSGGNSGNVVQRLRSEGLIQERRGLHGRISVYQLTARGAQSCDLPIRRAQPFGAEALQKHLGVLWFCCMENKARRRLERSHLIQLFGEAAPASPLPPHCLEPGEKSRLLRVFVAASRTDVSHLVSRVRGIMHKAMDKPALETWIRNRQYGFALLAEHAEKQKRIKAVLQMEGLRRLAHFHVGYAPGPDTIRKAIS